MLFKKYVKMVVNTILFVIAHSYKCFGAPLIYILRGENISAHCKNV